MHEVASMMHLCPDLAHQGLLASVLVLVLLPVLIPVSVLVPVLVLVHVLVHVLLVPLFHVTAVTFYTHHQ